MSKDTVTEFYAALKSDRGLAEEFKNAAVSANLDSLEKATNFTVDFAAEKGFTFTAGALKSFETKTRELSAEELNNVNAAGGETCGLCIFLGVGMFAAYESMGDSYRGVGETYCLVLGVGLGAWFSA